ncbi:MAG: CoA-transferase family [Frondihabitans sp.]|jgi:crotonobetainyl-CoA:carnitine CoA-transferase CaiB-like acyl-CoA transferase|nr:CoA-transferase family [Frondihabitans sp.]
MSEFPTTEAIAAELWSALGGAAPLLQRTSFQGVGAFRSKFAVTDLAAAVFGVCGLALSELVELADGGTPKVRVDRPMSSQWFDLPGGPSKRLTDAALPTGFKSHWMIEFPTRDDRWLRVQGGRPTLRARMTRALGTSEDHAEIAAAIRQYDADDVEAFLVEAGAAVAASRSGAEWAAHEQGIAVAAEPIVDVKERPDTVPWAWSPVPGRPLAGIRVLDLTRVAAGPLATRFLAAAGADVLRIDAPGSDEGTIATTGNDLGLGKRWAFLDIRTPAGKATFLRLLSEADLFIHTYRPGAIDSLVSPEEREAANPGLVEVAMDAYGWTGPWKGRRGFDTLVQFSSGLANDTTEWSLADPDRRIPINALGLQVDASRPRHLSVEALDLATGYQVAAAAIRGITRRLTTGRGSVSRLSLARTAALLARTRADEGEELIRIPLDGPFDPQIYAAAGAPVNRIAFPLTIDGNALFWERPAEAAGASTPMWPGER